MTDPRIEAALEVAWKYSEPYADGVTLESYNKSAPSVANIFRQSIIAALAAADAAAWRPIESAPRDCVFLALVDGHVRFVSYTKASHLRLYGFCLMDQGSEDIDI